MIKDITIAPYAGAKNSSANAGAVVNAKFLNIKNRTLLHDQTSEWVSGMLFLLS